MVGSSLPPGSAGSRGPHGHSFAVTAPRAGKLGNQRGILWAGGKRGTRRPSGQPNPLWLDGAQPRSEQLVKSE